MLGRTFLLGVTVVIQFLLEATLGRVSYVPSLIPLVLVYFSVNFEKLWAVDGAFWAGLALDLLAHQPVGSSSLALLVGMYVAGVLERMTSSEGVFLLTGMAVVSTVVSDVLFVLLASRPLGSALGVSMLYTVAMRMLLTAAAALFLFTCSSWISGLRAGRAAK